MDRSPDGAGRLETGDGQLQLTGEAGRYLHIERALELDGSDESPLLVEAELSIPDRQTLQQLPIVVALYWGPSALAAVSPVPGNHDSMTFTVRTVRGADETQVRDGAQYRYGTSVRLRFVVTSRVIGIAASSDGLRYRSIATVSRNAFGGPPARLIAGRGWRGSKPDTSAPDLDNDDDSRKKKNQQQKLMLAQLTTQEWLEAMKTPSPHKNKKKYSRKQKHKNSQY